MIDDFALTADHLTPTDSWIRSLYQNVLDRTPGDGELSAWLGAAPPGTRPVHIADTFLNSSEHRELLVRHLYETYLGRPADSAGLDGWLSLLGAGVPQETVPSAILGSGEYFARQGSVPDTFVRSLYHHLLGRTPHPSEVGAWTGGILAGTPRMTIAHGFLTSHEFRSTLVSQWYRQYLLRPADRVGLEHWIGHLAAGFSWTYVQARMLTSPEYATQTNWGPFYGRMSGKRGYEVPPEGVAFPVVDVIDGDTIKIAVNGKEEQVRLLGVDAAEERDRKAKDLLHYGSARVSAGIAGGQRDYLSNLVSGRQVTLRYSQSGPVRDLTRDHRILAYVWVGSLDVNATMARDGYTYDFQCDWAAPWKVLAHDRMNEFSALVEQAQGARRGVWAL